MKRKTKDSKFNFYHLHDSLSITHLAYAEYLMLSIMGDLMSISLLMVLMSLYKSDVLPLGLTNILDLVEYDMALALRSF
ncbi:unnamed protein product [Cuscuta epithymum]|uniref:Uncharacterized protein n=1 Tax=Cuscuta epithymum TaxID=186058 RepID=A0AAV0GKX2_9ASTE|nr:unnamed protein product [Cuscuta epithymum]CAH9148518.1 unnamed protein product [Cuscuta epithymum]